MRSKKSPKDKRRSVKNTKAQPTHVPAVQFKDNRPENVHQLKIKDMIDMSQSGSGAVIQMAKEKYLGKKKRRRKEQEAEMAEMDRVNKAWEEEHGTEEPVHQGNPFAVLDGLEEESADHEESTGESTSDHSESGITHEELPTVTIETLASAKGPLSATLIEAGYPEDVAGQMSRTYRSARGRFDSLADLERAALRKMDRRDSMLHSSIIGSASLNRKGGPVSGLSKGMGRGFKAGTGSTWHVHFDHVKYGSSGASRIDFSGRTKKQVLEALDAISGSYPSTNLAKCRAWINKNL